MTIQYDEMARVTPEQWALLRRRCMTSTLPAVIAERDGYRLVHQRRDEKTWPNMSDLTLERISEDAMGVPYWRQVVAWTISAQREPISEGQKPTLLALKLLLTTGPAIDTSPRPHL
jgi:hypothetical protein